MTDWEKAVVMAYTGAVMLAGDKLGIYYRYIQEKLGRPVWTHEFAGEEMAQKIKEAAKPDFLEICADEEQHFGPDQLPGVAKNYCENCISHISTPLTHGFEVQRNRKPHEGTADGTCVEGKV